MAVLGCFGILALVPVVAVFRAYVLSVLWGWFLTPIIHAPPPSLALLIGLSLIVGMFLDGVARSDEVATDKSSTEKIVGLVVKAFLSPALALAFGAIVHHFA